MKITIIHKPGCPLCELAIREFTEDGHEVELYGDLMDIQDVDRRNDMLTDLVCCDGDKSVFPQVFICDRFIHWKPKGA